MRAIWNGVVIADSEETRHVEGNHYFPSSAIKREYLSDSQTTSVCGWKGTANYYNIEVDGKTNPDAAWYYAEPKSAASDIKGYVAFWKGVEVSA